MLILSGRIRIHRRLQNLKRNILIDKYNFKISFVRL